MTVIFILAVCMALFTIYRCAKIEKHTSEMMSKAVKVECLNYVDDVIIQDGEGTSVTPSLEKLYYFIDSKGNVYIELEIDKMTGIPFVRPSKYKAFYTEDSRPYIPTHVKDSVVITDR